MTDIAITALLQEARIKIKGYASGEALRLVEEAIKGLGERVSPTEFEQEMIHFAERAKLNREFEWAHRDADASMCRVLEQHGYTKGVQVFENMDKWYA